MNVIEFKDKYLIANNIDTIFQVGKSGVTETLIKQVDDALTARELIKLKVLETAPDSQRDTAEKLAEATNAEVVQVIGTKIVLFRINPKDNKIKI